MGTLHKRVGRCYRTVVMATVLSVASAAPSTAQDTLSPYTSNTFTPDGDISEFINDGGDSQAYFVVNVVDPNFGKIRSTATLARGVFVGLDGNPAGSGTGAAGPSGFRDNPGNNVLGPVPTGFNVGRMFFSYNPELDPDGNAANGTGVYFIAMDISAPAELDSQYGTQPTSFDVDGDGDQGAQTEIAAPFSISEAPIAVADEYRFQIDTNRSSLANVEIIFAERGAGAGETPLLPPGAIALGAPQAIPNNPGTSDDDGVSQRYVLVLGIGGGTEAGLLPYLDWNNNGSIDPGDFGIGDDLEIAIMNVSALPLNNEPLCSRFAVTADTFDDVKLGGGAEDRVVAEGRFPDPQLEVIKRVRCVDEPDAPFSDHVSVLSGSTVEFEIAIENTGNRDLQVSIDDVLSCVAPADAQLVPGSCAVQGATPPGVIADFCTALEAALGPPSGFPLDIGILAAGDECVAASLPDPTPQRARQSGTTAGLIRIDSDPATRNTLPTDGDVLTFRFRVIVGSAEGDPAFCDDDVDCTNAITVTGTLTEPINPVRDEQEENGAVDDEFTIVVVDEAGTIDTKREDEGGADDNVVSLDIVCQAIDLTKEVRRLPDGSFTTGDAFLSLADGGFPIDIEYRYTVDNDGEIDEAVTITDLFLCQDVAGTTGVELIAGQCPLCEGLPPNEAGTIADTVPAGTSRSYTCQIRFTSQMGLGAFLTRDDSRSDCTADPSPSVADTCCYRNCAGVVASATGGQGVCGAVREIDVDSHSTVCSGDESPTCDANGPYVAECSGPSQSFPLDGSGSLGSALVYAWSTDCPGGVIDQPATESPQLTLTTNPVCRTECSVELTVENCGGVDSCSAMVRVTDTLPPQLTCPPDAFVPEGQSTDPSATGSPTASDSCDPNPTVEFTDVEGGRCVILRTWKARDACGNQRECTQRIELECDETVPTVSEWGLIVLALLLLVVAKTSFGTRRRTA